MKIELLPSGSYRIRKMYKGKTYTVITEYKPTQKEALKLLSDVMEDDASDNKKPSRLTLKKACESYVESRKTVLSPTTIHSYGSIIATIGKDIADMPISDITSEDIQMQIKSWCVGHNPKTVINRYSLIVAVLKEYRPSFRPTVSLPKRMKTFNYIPTEDDIRAILKKAEGTYFDIPVRLACMGLRKSEIFALTPADLNGNELTINKAMVRGLDYNWIVKSTTKTAASTRKIIIPQSLADRINESGCIFHGCPDQIGTWLSQTQDELGLPRFSLHKFRHYFASKLSNMGVPEVDILRLGGWETDGIMKTVYRHSMDQKNEIALKVADAINDSIF